jgi:hypothetical protein
MLLPCARCERLPAGILFKFNKLGTMEEDQAVAIEWRSGLGNVLVARKSFKPGVFVSSNDIEDIQLPTCRLLAIVAATAADLLLRQ